MLKSFIYGINLASKRSQTSGQLSLEGAKFISYYITTPIFYVNSSPHIGHVYTLLVADALNIYHRLKLGHNQTLFSAGTDEHGLKIQTAAEQEAIECQKFCDLNASKFKHLITEYDTTVGQFIRTTDEKHKQAVRSVWLELEKGNYIYKSTYSGWYCNADETFVPDSQVTKRDDGKGTITHIDSNDNQVLWSSEENYMFKLSHFIDKVLEWLSTTKPIIPEKFNSEAISMIGRSDIGDISISRPRKRLAWGIQVPNDPSQTIYVWLDALTNYLTAVGYPSTCELKRWPIDCQVIGKDIIKFHAIYWPAFLMALSLPLPRQLLCHSHWLMDSRKMSKSRGNVADPFEENQVLTVEGLRYYLLRNGTPHSDSDYSRTSAYRRINSEMADTYGNLLSRCSGSAINPSGTIPTKVSANLAEQGQELKEKLENLSEEVDRHYKCGDFYRGLEEIMQVLRINNAFYEETKPWKLVKQIESCESSFEIYSNLQALTFETMRISSILLQPIIPKTSGLALDRLGTKDRSWADAQYSLEVGDSRNGSRSIDKSFPSVTFSRLKVNV